jgi:hypothetical protein
VQVYKVYTEPLEKKLENAFNCVCLQKCLMWLFKASLPGAREATSIDGIKWMAIRPLANGCGYYLDNLTLD